MRKLNGFSLSLMILVILSPVFVSTHKVQAQYEWNIYHRYTEIVEGLQDLESSGIAQVITIGETTRWNTEIKAVKISDNPGIDEENEPDILFVGLHHAREWIAAEVPYYIATNLVQQYSTDPYIKDLVDNCQIWIVPVLNPDGFEYSQDYYRYWRKNSRDNGDGTYGVDLNRNYDWIWGTDLDPSVESDGSPDTSSYMYWGQEAFSEDETNAIKSLLRGPPFSLPHIFKAVLSYHSFGQLILYPWAHTDLPTPDDDIMQSMADEMSQLIQNVHGKYYEPMESHDLYKQSGEFMDWAYGELDIPAFTVELRPESADPWYTGFELDENEILSTCEENWPAALYLIDYVIDHSTPSLYSCSIRGAGFESSSPKDRRYFLDMPPWSESVWIYGYGYGSSETYDLYIVNDVSLWTDGLSIPARVLGTETSISSGLVGQIPPPLGVGWSPFIAWELPLTSGKYDIIVDVNLNGQYDLGIDGLRENIIVLEPQVESARNRDWMLPSEEFYVEGSGFPPNKEIFIIIVPLGDYTNVDLREGSYVFGYGFTSLRTNDDGSIPATIIPVELTGGETSLPTGEYRIFVDVDYNGRITFGDCFSSIPIQVVEEPPIEITPNNIETATGSGIAIVTPSSGDLLSLESIDETAFPQEGKPEGVEFPDGLYSFVIGGLLDGETITVTILQPTDVPVGSVYWTYQQSLGWYWIPIGSDNGDNEITITITDGGVGDADETVNSVIVDPGGLIFHNPVADANGVYEAFEGSEILLDASMSNDPDGDSLLYRWDVDGNQYWDTSWMFSPTHNITWSDDWDSSVTVEVFDGLLFDMDSTWLTVINVPPTVDAGPDQSVDEGSLITLSGSFTDPGEDSWSATVDYGDGTGEQPLTLTGKTFALSNTYGDNGAYTITVTVTDDDGGVGVDTVTITVNNLAPSADAGPDQTILNTQPVYFTGYSTDQGSDDLTFTWEWGDGSPTTITTYYNDGTGPDPYPSPGPIYPVTVNDPVSHIYSERGVYTVMLTVSDDDGGVSMDTVRVAVLPYSDLTTSSLCPDFDTEPDITSDQFRIIYTPDVNNDPSLYKVTATNPGQFYYNVFKIGDIKPTKPFIIMIPYPFTPKGANPVHVYNSVDILSTGCYSTLGANDITEEFDITLDSQRIDIIPKTSGSGTYYITMHLDYELKQTTGYEPNPYDINDLSKADAAIDDVVVIEDLTDYEFSVSGPITDTQTVQNRNAFKKIRGIIGYVSDFEPNVDVTIYGSDWTEYVSTDEDGFFGYSFHHKGKRYKYIVSASGYIDVEVWLKAGRFGEAILVLK